MVIGDDGRVGQGHHAQRIRLVVAMCGETGAGEGWVGGLELSSAGRRPRLPLASSSTMLGKDPMCMCRKVEEGWRREIRMLWMERGGYKKL